MRAFLAFLKKEWLEVARSGKLVLLTILFVSLGIMNPAIAKLTPWLMEMMSEELADSGMVIVGVEVNALTSWTQFFKNIPIGLIVMVVVFSSSFTKEYGNGTLTLLLTKGLARYKVLLAKTTVMLLFWTVGYYLCFGVTYAYNAYFWDNSIAIGIGSAVVYWWLFGICILMGLVMLSTVCGSSSSVLIGVGGMALFFYLLAFIPRLGDYSPATLMGSSEIVFGTSACGDFAGSAIVTIVLSAVFYTVSIPLINRKQL